MRALFRRLTDLTARAARTSPSPLAAAEILEDRILLAAQPVVSVVAADGHAAADGGTEQVNIGDTTQVTLRFDNAAPAASNDVGYSPYIDLILPTNGADGAGVGNSPQNDGITFQGATYLGANLQAVQIEFDVNGQAVHPFAKNADGSARVITLDPDGPYRPGDMLVVLTLPFGSFTANQTPIDVLVNLGVSNHADIGAPLSLQAQGGFAFGADPLNNPTTDNPILGNPVSFSIDPTLAELVKIYEGPEQETATGPSYPRSWLITPELAPGQSVTNMVLTDTLPDGVVYTGATLLNGYTGTISLSPDGRTVTAQINGTVTGGGPLPELRINFYVAEMLSDGITPVLDPATGGFRQLENNASIDFDWDPIDTRDTLQHVTIDPIGPENTITAKSVAIQKSVSVVEGGTAAPDKHLEWTLDGQVSDYFALDNLVVTDVMSDGQHFDFSPGAEPTIVITEHGVPVLTATLSASHYSVTRNADGTTTISFNISQAMVDLGLAEGLDAVLGSDQSTGTETGVEGVRLVFRSVVDHEYFNPNPDTFLVEGDTLDNDVTFGGEVLGTNNVISDTSAASAQIDVATIAKEIYAVNGDTNFTPAPVQSGDTITYKLTLDMPLTRAQNLKLIDFLPLPVFSATDLDANGTVGDLMAFIGAVTGTTVPGVGQAAFGPGDTFHTFLSNTPTITQDTAQNSLSFDFGSLLTGSNQAARLEILFTVAVQDQPFGDGLLLTNQVTAEEQSSHGIITQTAAITQFVVGEPELSITKGVVATSSSDGTLTGSDGPATVTFSAPGSAGPRFTGDVINSNALAGNAIDANLTGVDAGDLVTFALTVENTGTGLYGAFDVVLRDTLPAGFQIPAGGLNLRVTNGAGIELNYELVGGGLFDPAGGIRLIDGAGQGAIHAYNATNGQNIVIITYDVVLVDAASFPQDNIDNTATIVSFAGIEGGNDRASSMDAADRSDTATVITAAPTIDKVVTSTDQGFTGSSEGNTTLQDLAIGETVTYTVTVTFPEGTASQVRLSDLLPAGSIGVLGFVSAQVISVGANLSGGAGLAVAQTGTVTDRDGDGVMDTVVFDFGNVTNTVDNLHSTADTVVIQVVARALDVAANARGDVLTNTATLSIDDPDGGPRVEFQDTANVELVEPNLQLEKSVTPGVADANDEVTYTITLTNGATGGFTTSAFDLSVIDNLGNLPPNSILKAQSVVLSGTAAALATVTSGNGIGDTNIRVDLSRLDVGQTLTITFQATLSPSAPAGSVITNTATATGSSLSGAPAVERSYNDSDDAQVQIAMPALGKTIVVTSNADTGSGQYNPGLQDLSIGEVVTYELVLTVPEGQSIDLALRDILPDANIAGAGGRLEYVAGSVQVMNIGSNLTGLTQDLNLPGVTATDGNGNGNAETIRITFGNVENTADNVVDGNDRIVIRLQARVVDHAANTGGQVLVNQGIAEANGQSSTAVTASAEVVEPRLVIDKTSSVAGGTPLDAGAEVTYTVTITHADANSGPAYDLALSDLLPSGMALVAGSLSTSVGSISSVGNTVTLTVPKLLVGDAAITVTYRAILLDSVTPGQTLTNTATLNYDTLQGAGGRAEPTLTDSTTQTVALTPSITKTVVDSSLPDTGSTALNPANPDASIGETVTYELVVAIGEGTQRLVVGDTLAAGLVYVSSEVFSIGGGISGSALAVGTAGSVAGQTLTFDFGTVVNAGDNLQNTGDTIVIRITARVADVAGNVSGTVLTNNAQVSTFGPGGGTPGLQQDSATADVDVVAPVLTVDKIASVGSGDGGDLVTYTVKINHAAGSTGPAYNLVLADDLPDGVVYVAGSAATNLGSVSELNGIITLTLPAAFRAADGEITLTYQVRLADAVTHGQVITNTAGLDYTSAPTDGRALEGSDDATVTVAISNTLTKQIVATSNPDTPGANVARGEEVTYHLTGTLGEGTQAIVLTDSIPAGFELVSWRVVQGGNPAFSQLGGVLTFDFGTTVNSAGSGGDDAIIVEVVTRLRDDAPNDPVANVATLTPDGSTPRQITDDADITVVEPVLNIAKASPSGFLRPGGTGTYTLTLTHDGASTGPAYDIQVQDLLANVAPWLSLIAGSVTTTAGTVITGNAPGDTTVGVSIASLLLNQSVTITFTVQVAANAPAGAVLPNTATLNWDSNPGTGGSTGNDSSSADVPIAPGLDKMLQDSSVIATTDPTDSQAFNPTQRDLSPGELVRYSIVVTLPQGATGGVIVSDDLAGGMLDLISSRVVSIGGDLSATGLGVGGAGTLLGGILRFNFGNVTGALDGTLPGAGDQIVIEVIGRVRADAVAGTSALNQGATLDFTLRGVAGQQQDVVTSDVVTPSLVITKSADTAGPVDAADIVGYTLQVTNTSAAPAFAIRVDDMLRPELISGGGVVVTVNGVVVPGAQILLGGTPGDSALSVLIPRLDPGQVAVIQFLGVIPNLQDAGITVDNHASVQWSSAPGTDPAGWPTTGGPNPNLRTDTVDSNEVSLPTRLPSITKVVAETDNAGTGNGQFDPSAPDVAPGETVTWRITISLEEGQTTLRLRDHLPDGFAYVGSRIVSYGANISGGNLPAGAAGVLDGSSILFDLGLLIDAANNAAQNGEDQIVIEVQARLLPGVLAAGAQRSNAAQLEVLDAGAVLPVASGPVDVVTPELTLDKTADATFAVIGQEIGYTLRLSHTAASTAPAYDILLTDAALPGFLRVVEGSVAVQGVVGAVIEYVDGGLRIRLPELALGQTLLVTYRVLPTNAPNDGQAPNTAVFTADSFPGVPRGATPGDGAEQQLDGSDRAVVTVAAGQPQREGTRFTDVAGREDRLEGFFRGFRSEPIYSGSADPGSTLVVNLRDWQGSVIASTTRVADAGGNWIANFPRTIGFRGDLPTTDDYLSATRLFRDLGERLLPETLERRQIPLRDGYDDRPFDVQVTVTSSGIGPLGDAPINTRIAYGDTSNPGAFTTRSDGAGIGTAAGALRAGTAAAAHPLSFAFNRFAGEFLASGPFSGGAR